MIYTGVTTATTANQFKNTNQSEIIDFSTSGSTKCPTWANYPHDTKGATGGFLGGNIIICGGTHQNSDECHIVSPTRTKVVTKMKSKRYEAASLVINENYLWISGGSDGSNTLYSSEFINIETMEGPDLPTDLKGTAALC